MTAGNRGIVMGRPRKIPPKFSPVYVGIDPGASGGMSVLSFAYSGAVPVVTSTAFGNATAKQIWESLPGTGRGLLADRQQVFVTIEKVGGFVKGSPMPGSAMFNFGKSYGMLLGFLTAAGIPHEEVTPQKWQKALGIIPRNKDEGKTDFKRRLRSLAESLFPREKITNATADALLIAEYCHRTRSGK